MKKAIAKFSFITIMLCVLMLATNCKKDDNHTIPKAPVEPRDKFEGSYSTTDTTYIIEPNIYTFSNCYGLGIYKNSSDTSKINIYNLNNSGNTIIAKVSGNSFIVSNQTYGSSGNMIHGSGSINNDKLIFNFTLDSLVHVQIYGIGFKIYFSPFKTKQ